MRLGELNRGIRELKGAPKTKAQFTLEDGTVIVLPGGVELVKTTLLAALKAAFPGGKNAETYLRLEEGGYIALDPDAKVTCQAWQSSAGQPSTTQATSAGDFDDMLGGDESETVAEAVVDELDDLLG